jgi:hypothetical protein
MNKSTLSSYGTSMGHIASVQTSNFNGSMNSIRLCPETAHKWPKWLVKAHFSMNSSSNNPRLFFSPAPGLSFGWRRKRMIYVPRIEPPIPLEARLRSPVLGTIARG